MPSRRGRERHLTLTPLIALLLAGLASGDGQAAPAATGAVLRENSPGRIVFEYTLGAWSLQPVELEGTTYQRVMASGLAATDRPGWPALPVAEVSLGIPFGVEPRLEVEILETKDFPGVLPLPRPTEEMAPWREPGPTTPEELAAGRGTWSYPVARLVADRAAYSSGALYPEAAARLSRVANLRHQRVARVVCQPFRFLAFERRLTVATRMRVALVLDPAKSDRAREQTMLRPAPDERPEWDDVYRALLLNSQESRPWRGRLEGVSSLSPRLGAPAWVAPAWEYRLKVMRSGFYRVAFDSLPAFPAGVAVLSLKVYQREYQGGATPIVEHLVPVRVVDEGSDGVFGAGDALVFYGLSFRDQWMTSADWEDAYTDTNVYWLSYADGGGSPAMAEEGAWFDFPSAVTPDSFSTSIFAEQDRLYFPFPAQREMDSWYWVGPGNTVPVLFPGIVNTLPLTVDVRLMGRGSSPPDYTYDTDTLSIVIPGSGSQVLGANSIQYSGWPDDFRVKVTAPTTLNGQETFGLQHTARPWPADNFDPLLDWYRMSYTRRYALESYEDSLSFHNAGRTGDLRFTVEGFHSAEIDLYRLHGAQGPVHLSGHHIVPDGDRFQVVFEQTVNDSTAYVALDRSVDRSVYLTPVAITRLEGALDLVNDPLEPDYLMVTYDDFAGGLAPLVAQREAQGYRVRVAPVSRVYDLFGNGLPSPQAIKSYIRHAYQEWNASYALLVGDASRDERGLDNDNPEDDLRSGPNFIPTYYLLDSDEWYPLRAHDGWYADLSEPADWVAEVAVGRFPVGNLEELAALVEKTLTMETLLPGEEWRRRVLFTADDQYKWRVDDPSVDCWAYFEDEFVLASEECADTVEASVTGRAVPVANNLQDWTYLYDPAQRPPACADISCCVNSSGVITYTRDTATPPLIQEVNDGVLIWNYEGHANRNLFTHEYVYVEDYEYQGEGRRKDSHRLTNRQRPFVFLGYGCYISMFDYKTEPWAGDGVGEKMLLWPEGGAAALYASPGLEYLTSNADLNESLMKYLWSTYRPAGGFAGLILGPATTAAVAAMGSPAMYRSYHILGDPALRLEIGPPLMAVTVNDSVVADGASLADYVMSGEARIVAEVADEGGLDSTILIDTRVSPTEPLTPGVHYTVETLVDSGATSPRRQRLTYVTEATLGDFEIRFRVPDTNGHETTFLLKGGLSISVEDDGTPVAPGIELPPEPQFLARIASPFPIAGADLGMRLDGELRGDVTRTPVGGEGQPDTSSRWELSLPPLDLSLGPHVLEVTYLQGGEHVALKTYDFRLRSDVGISYVVGYPNPFAEETSIVYELMPQAASVEADVYTVSGRKIVTLRGGSGYTGRGQNQLAWDGRDEHGDRVASGVYLFRLRVRSEAGVETSRMGRLVKVTGVE